LAQALWLKILTQACRSAFSALALTQTVRVSGHTMGTTSSKTKPEARDGTTKDPEERAVITMELQDLQCKNKALEDTLNVMNNQIAEKKGKAKYPKDKLLTALPQLDDPAFARMTLTQLMDQKSKLEESWNRLKEIEEEFRKEIFGSSGFRVFGINNATNNASCLNEGPFEDPFLLVRPDDDELHDAGSKQLYGVDWQTQWASEPSGPRDEAHRKKVREGTRAKVVTELGLSYFGQAVPTGQGQEPRWPACRNTTLFLDQSPASKEGIAAAGDAYLLGRYDVVCVRTCTDFDRSWNFLKGPRNNFWVAHAAALNIGESTEATDFPDFCRLENNTGEASGRLDEERYFEAMSQIVDNIVYACNDLKAEHVVFFPFGMGAFLRHLGQLDGTFEDDVSLQRLRRRLGNVFMTCFKRLSSKARVHICLQLGTEEAQRNADAFFRAVTAVDKNLKKRITVIPEGDSLSVASQLANTSVNVVLVNGANRQLLGNHWFAGRARLAIDENLHRRSWRMAALSYLLNGFDGREPSGRRPHSLQHAVETMSGTVRVIKPSKQ